MALSSGDKLGPYEILANWARAVWAKCGRRGTVVSIARSQ
jgi:hypothetical protein